MSASRVCKITLLGDGAVGKTSLRDRFMGKPFSADYRMTIGTDFAIKMVETDGQQIKFQIWDIAGQPHFTKVRKLYYEGSIGSLVVFDIAAPDTFHNVLHWIEELWKNNGKGLIPVILLGNKLDLRDIGKDTLQSSYGETLAEKLSENSIAKGFDVPYVETSAKTGENVDHAFSLLSQNISSFIAQSTKD